MPILKFNKSIEFIVFFFYQYIQIALQKVREGLEARGSKTIRSLGRTFRELDSYNGDNKVDRDEFIVGLRENGVNLSKNEFDVNFIY